MCLWKLTLLQYYYNIQNIYLSSATALCFLWSLFTLHGTSVHYRLIYSFVHSFINKGYLMSPFYCNEMFRGVRKLLYFEETHANMQDSTHTEIPGSV